MVCHVSVLNFICHISNHVFKCIQVFLESVSCYVLDSFNHAVPLIRPLFCFQKVLCSFFAGIEVSQETWTTDFHSLCIRCFTWLDYLSGIPDTTNTNYFKILNYLFANKSHNIAEACVTYDVFIQCAFLLTFYPSIGLSLIICRFAATSIVGLRIQPTQR